MRERISGGKLLRRTQAAVWRLTTHTRSVPLFAAARALPGPRRICSVHGSGKEVRVFASHQLQPRVEVCSSKRRQGDIDVARQVLAAALLALQHCNGLVSRVRALYQSVGITMLFFALPALSVDAQCLAQDLPILPRKGGCPSGHNAHVAPHDERTRVVN